VYPCREETRKKGGRTHTDIKGRCSSINLSCGSPRAYNNDFKTIQISLCCCRWFFQIRVDLPDENHEYQGSLKKLQSQQKVFGNPYRIISNRGSAFTSNDFQNYCREENIEHILITMGVPRGNGQVKRINRIIIPTKLSHDQPDKWFKYVHRVQVAVNSTYQRSIGTSPFEVLFGVKMRRKENPELLSLIEVESIATFAEGRQELRKLAQENISRVQRENQRTHNRKCKSATQYKEDDLVVIKRT